MHTHLRGITKKKTYKNSISHLCRHSMTQAKYEIPVKGFSFSYNTNFFKTNTLLYTGFPMHIALLTVIKESISLCSPLLCTCLVLHELGNGYKNKKKPYGRQESKGVFPKFL